ncbi:uncharacterized protein V3H82_021099 [Fundulus diaphanus]
MNPDTTWDLPAGADTPEIRAYLDMCERLRRERYARMASARDPAPPIKADSTPQVFYVGVVATTPEHEKRSRRSLHRLGHHLYDSQLAPRVKLNVPSIRAPHVEEDQLWSFYYGDRDDLLPRGPAATPLTASVPPSGSSRLGRRALRRIKASEDSLPLKSHEGVQEDPPTEACSPAASEVAEEMVPPPPENSALPTAEGSALPATLRSAEASEGAALPQPEASEGAALPQPDASEGAALPQAEASEGHLCV